MGKLIDMMGYASSLNALRKEFRSRRVGMVNGCFDLLHPGHIDFLRKSKSFCDVLVVAINDDKSIFGLKNRESYFSLEHRIALLQELQWVNYIVPFNSESMLVGVIRELQPDYLFKSSEYALDVITGLTQLKSNSNPGILVQLERIPDWSTSKIVKEIFLKVIDPWGTPTKVDPLKLFVESRGGEQPKEESDSEDHSYYDLGL